MIKRFNKKGGLFVKLRTKHLGEIEIQKDDIYTFLNGLPAFEQETEFALLPFSQDELFYILQSTKTEEVAFVLTNPFHFFHDYEVRLTDALKSQLDIMKKEEVAIFSVLTLQEPFRKTTANLQAPIILNVTKKQGKQFVMSDSGYETKHYLFPQEPATIPEKKGEG